MIRDLMQPMHLLIIALVAIVLFGGKKFAEMGKGLGDGIREFKKGIREMRDATNEVKK